MVLETQRLEWMPLPPRELKLWTEDLPALEREWNCRYQAEPVEGVFLEIIKGQLEKTEKAPDDYRWYSFWFLIRKKDRVVVGSADFKDVPNAEGEVELGYGLGKEFEHHGYMTEAVNAMCGWALKQKDVLHILAETDANGFASQRVLQRCGFTEKMRSETIWWKL